MQNRAQMKESKCAKDILMCANEKHREDITLCILGNFSWALSSAVVFFFSKLFFSKYSFRITISQIVWIQIRPDKMSG